MFKFLGLLILNLAIIVSVPVSYLSAQDEEEIELEKELKSGEENTLEELDDDKSELKQSKNVRPDQKQQPPDPQLTGPEEQSVAKPQRPQGPQQSQKPDWPSEPQKDVVLKGPDDPDIELENRLFKIFSELKGPIDEASWKKIVGRRHKETYKLQKGDTLWDISKTLFGDPFYWPKVWAVNENITNPHFVREGLVLSFYQGTLSEEPEIDIKPETPPEPMALSVADSSSTPSESEEDEEKLEFLPAEDSDLLPSSGLRAETADQVIIPPSKRKFPPTLKVIPPSLPVWDNLREGMPSNANVTFSGAPPSAPQAVSIPLPAFLADEYPDSVGQIVEFRDDASTGSNYQYVYAEVENGKVGDTLLVFSLLKKPKKFYKILSGVPISVDGQIKLVEKVDDDLFKAIIVANVNAITAGADLMYLELPMVELSTIGPILNVEGQIGGGYLEGLTEFYSPGSFLFLDVGRAQGIKVGGLIYALANEQIRNRKTVDSENKRDVGLLKIVYVSENTSTAVVVQANDVIMAGDFVGKPDRLSQELVNISRHEVKTSISLLEELAKEEQLEQEKKANAGPRKPRVQKTKEGNQQTKESHPKAKKSNDKTHTDTEGGREPNNKTHRR